MLRAFAALAMAGAFTVTAYALSLRLAGQGSALRRLCATVIVAMALATILFHALIGCGQFRLAIAMAALACLAAATLRWIVPPAEWRERWLDDLARFRRAGSLLLSTGARRAGAALIFLFMLLALTRTLLLPPLGWDTLTYHGVKAALWAQQGRPDLFPAPGGWGSKILLPGGSELLQAWALLPFRSDLLLGFLDFVFWLALGAFIVQFARELGLTTKAGALGALYLLFLPALRLQIGSGYGELPLMCALLGGLSYSIHFLRQRDPPSLVIAFAAFGMAAGIKAHVWPALAWAGLVLLAGACCRGRASARKCRPALLAGILAALLMVLPWPALNLRAGRLPLSPFPIRVAGLVLGESTPSYHTYHHREGVRHGDLREEIQAGRDLFATPLSTWPHLGLLTLPLGVAGWISLVRFRRMGAANALLLAGFIGLTAWVFWGPSFAVIRLLWSTTSARFLLPAFVPASLLGLAWLWTKPRLRLVLAAALILLALLHAGRAACQGWAPFEFRVIPKSAGLLAALAASLVILSRINRRAVVSGVVTAALLAASLTAIQKERDHLRYKALKQSIVLHWVENPWADGARALDDPAVPRRLAVTTGIDYNGDNWFLYFFLGRRFQNTVTYISPTASGRVLDAQSVEELRDRVDSRAWLRRLGQAGITHVVSLAPESLELAFMTKHPGLFTPVAGDGGTWGVFEVATSPSSYGRSTPSRK
ncbi:MAG TPA: hypothetical protein P5567_05190 [Kiritimatiellia bacterium]|nr:hypothetical protein [Kiritimatiellia bacterium]HSA17363.1 hypothetical protein [Kiritimatiellia bacterium]